MNNNLRYIHDFTNIFVYSFTKPINSSCLSEQEGLAVLENQASSLKLQQCDMILLVYKEKLCPEEEIVVGQVKME